MEGKDVPDHGLDALDELGVLLVGGEGTRANGAHNVVVVDRLLLLESEEGRAGEGEENEFLWVEEWVQRREGGVDHNM